MLLISIKIIYFDYLHNILIFNLKTLIRYNLPIPQSFISNFLTGFDMLQFYWISCQWHIKGNFQTKYRTCFSNKFRIHCGKYSNFGNTYLSKEFARVLGPGQIVKSLEHLAQRRGGSSLNTWHTAEVFKWRLCGLGLTHVRLFWQINISKSYTIHTNK